MTAEGKQTYTTVPLRIALLVVLHQTVVTYSEKSSTVLGIHYSNMAADACGVPLYMHAWPQSANGCRHWSASKYPRIRGDMAFYVTATSVGWNNRYRRIAHTAWCITAISASIGTPGTESWCSHLQVLRCIRNLSPDWHSKADCLLCDWWYQTRLLRVTAVQGFSLNFEQNVASIEPTGLNGEKISQVGLCRSQFPDAALAAGKMCGGGRCGLVKFVQPRFTAMDVRCWPYPAVVCGAAPRLRKERAKCSLPLATRFVLVTENSALQLR